MRAKVTMEITQEASEELEILSGFLGWPQEAALLYAVRLVNACIREGLIGDVPAHAWPEQAAPLHGTGTGGKVLSFPARKASPERKD